MSLENVTDASFEAEVLLSEKPVVVDFWAEWCAPCRQLMSVLEDLSEELKASVRFVKVAVDENPDSASKYHVRSVPTLVLFKGGEVVATHTGVQPKGILRSWVESSL